MPERKERQDGPLDRGQELYVQLNQSEEAIATQNTIISHTESFDFTTAYTHAMSLISNERNRADIKRRMMNITGQVNKAEECEKFIDICWYIHDSAQAGDIAPLSDFLTARINQMYRAFPESETPDELMYLDNTMKGYKRIVDVLSEDYHLDE